jgi:hypothetical protein
MAATVKAGARPRPARAPRPAIPAAPPQPPAAGAPRFTIPAEPAEEEREPLFYVDDVPYTIPADPGPGIAIEAMHIGAVRGEAYAEDYFMGAMLGDDGWAVLRRLMREKAVTWKDYLRLVEVCRDKTMGALEDEESPNR